MIRKQRFLKANKTDFSFYFLWHCICRLTLYRSLHSGNQLYCIITHTQPHPSPTSPSLLPLRSPPFDKKFGPVRGSDPLEALSHQRFGLITGWGIKGPVHQRSGPLEVRSHYRLGNQRFDPLEVWELEVRSIRGSVTYRFGSLQVRSHQRFSTITGSGIRGSVPLEVRELEVQYHFRFSPIIGSGIRGSVPLEVRELWVPESKVPELQVGNQ